ncbi:MAG: hypothetical protein RL748_2250, partial [Pseudomonadota bacterium]
MHSSPFRLPSGQALLPELAWIVLIWIGLCGAATSSLAASPAAANASSASSASSTRPGWWHLADPHFSRLPTENALPSNAITALAEDRYGFIWIGTQNGLARWDGYRLRNYQHDPANPHSLPSSFIQVLHLDAQGMLWAGSANGGLAWYNTRTDTFEPIPVGPGGSSHASILNMADDGQGGLLVITAGGLDQIVAERNGFKVKPLALFQLPGAPAPTTAPPLRLAPGEFALRLLHDRQDRIWLSTSLGLRLRDPQTGQFKLLPLQNPDSNPMPGKAPAPLFIISMHQASDGRIWLGTTMQGVFIFEPDKQQLTRLSQVGDNPALKQLQHDQISAILEVQPGEIWIATPPSGLLKMDVASRQIRWIKANPSLPGSLPNDTLCCMLRARSGQIWLGTQDSVSHYLPGAVHTLRANQALPDHLADPNMQAIRTMPDGRIFLGGVKHGLNTIDPAQQIIQRTRPGDLPTDWPYTVIRDISSPLDGKVLLGTDHGLFQTEPDGSRIRPLPLAKAGPEVSITSMLVQGDDVWLGSGFGLLHLNARTGLVPGKGQLIASLERQFISTMVPGQDHTLWLGTMNNGVFQYTPSSGKLRHIVPRPGSAQGLPSKIITSLLQDSRGWLWVSTLDAGISVNQAPQRDLFINLSTAQGL